MQILFPLLSVILTPHLSHRLAIRVCLDWRVFSSHASTPKSKVGHPAQPPHSQPVSPAVTSPPLSTCPLFLINQQQTILDCLLLLQGPRRHFLPPLDPPQMALGPSSSRTLSTRVASHKVVHHHGYNNPLANQEPPCRRHHRVVLGPRILLARKASVIYRNNQIPSKYERKHR